ncbi:MAG: sulfatase-like hydrolase/transferase [Planctomycetes bacterium]|nr:sulfatase-like hydrolase/transferase [Planctomycetota bacterium]
MFGSGRRKRPNIVFIFSDQQRWDTVGCYGSPLFEKLTVNLDRLARKGVRFENSFTCQPVCGPARSSLQTGKWATETGCYRNGIALPGDEKTIAHWLGEAGYEVGYLGKWHLASTSGVAGHNVDYRTKAIPSERRGGYRDFWLAADVLEFTSHSYDGHMFDGRGAFFSVFDFQVLVAYAIIPVKAYGYYALYHCVPAVSDIHHRIYHRKAAPAAQGRPGAGGLLL